MERVTVRIYDCDRRGYDLFFNAPLGMNEKDAVQVVDKCVIKVKEANPASYTFEDLEWELHLYGFVKLNCAMANALW